MSQQVTWTELPEFRERFGNDKRAINRHSVRCYKVDDNDNYYVLDRTNDMSPPHFEMLELDSDPRITVTNMPKTIKIDGERHWGGGISWPQAEEKAINKVREMFAVAMA